MRARESQGGRAGFKVSFITVRWHVKLKCLFSSSAKATLQNIKQNQQPTPRPHVTSRTALTTKCKYQACRDSHGFICT